MTARVQLRRAKGWRMPPNTVKVDRSTKWGNPWTIAKARAAGYHGTDAEIRAFCVQCFHKAMVNGLPAVDRIRADLSQLRSRNLACWCPPDQPCHADILLEFANKEPV